MRVRLRPLLLPVEHGGWALLLEPVVIGLIAAPSAASAWLALAALSLFLSRQPLRVVMDDVAERRRVPRTQVAGIVAVVYLGLAALFGGAASRVAGQSFWPMVAVAALWALVQIGFDAARASRRLLPELAGVAALGGVAAAMGRATGWSTPDAVGLWAAAAMRTAPAIVTVRVRVRRLHGEPADGVGPAIAHGFACVGAFALALTGLVPGGAVIVAVLSAIRAAWTLRAGQPVLPASRLGPQELVAGLVTAAVIGLLFRFQGTL
jgi:hypothetical protein